jgi:transcriptional regulator with XRE-family HTH domain
MIPGMSARTRRLNEAVRSLDRACRELGDELREARLQAGLRLDDVARAVGVSRSTVVRDERGESLRTAPETLAAHAAVVGLRLGLRAFPVGPPVRDTAQLALMTAFRNRIVDGHWRWEYEVGLPIPGDRRALDAVISRPACRCGLEFFVRFHDCQAQLRRVLLKQRDAELPRLIVVVRGTNANRRALHAAEEVIRAALPLATRGVLAALSRGRDPGANGLVVL